MSPNDWVDLFDCDGKFDPKCDGSKRMTSLFRHKTGGSLKSITVILIGQRISEHYWNGVAMHRSKNPSTGHCDRPF